MFVVLFFCRSCWFFVVAVGVVVVVAVCIFAAIVVVDVVVAVAVFVVAVCWFLFAVVCVGAAVFSSNQSFHLACGACGKR